MFWSSAMCVHGFMSGEQVTLQVGDRMCSRSQDKLKQSSPLPISYSKHHHQREHQYKASATRYLAIKAKSICYG